MQIRCRNCGVAQDVPAFHGSLLVTCPECDWQETLPARRHLPKSLDNRAGHAFQARAEHETAVHGVVDQLPALTPRRFTNFIAAMFAADGYDVALADPMFDQSHALELRAGTTRVFVACRPGTPSIPADDVERLVGSMRHSGADHATYVTTGTFDEACAAFAEAVDLIDGQRLLKQLVNEPFEKLQAWLEAVAPESDSA